jgi:hypothetical protein
VNTGNRLLWTTIGAVLTAAGVFGVLLSQDWLFSGTSRRTVLGPAVARRWHDWHGYAVTVFIVAGLLLAVLGFLLLRSQLRGRGGAPMHDLVLVNHPPVTVPADFSDDVALREAFVPGRIRITSNALEQALSRDLRAHATVRRAAVRLVGDPDRPEALVRLSVTADADVPRLRSHVDSALDRLAATSGIRPSVHDVVVTMADQPPARVQ